MRRANSKVCSEQLEILSYNQVVKALNANFTEKKALTFLYKLEKATLELVELNQKVIELTQEFEQKWLQK